MRSRWVQMGRLGRRRERALAARCGRALFGAAREHWHGPRAVLRRAVRRWLRAHRGDPAQLARVLRQLAAGSVFALALLGLGADPAHAGRSAAFTQQTGAANPLDGQDVGNHSKATFADLDGDGDLDLLAGNFAGLFSYFENTGTATSPAFTPRTGAANPLDGEDVGNYSAPAFADLDGDGDLDLLAGRLDGKFSYFENTGTAASPAFIERTGAANPLDGDDAGSRSAPAFADLDGDGDLDLLAGEYDGIFAYFENTGTADSPTFTERTGAANPLDGKDLDYGSRPAFADLDGDGDFDLLSGDFLGTFFYFENTGTAISPAFIERTGAANPLDGENVGYRSAPAFADLDGDGDLDLLSGEVFGELFYLENTGTATGQGFTLLTGAANPLAGEDVGLYAAPTFADLDGDGDLDLVSGGYEFECFYFENTGTAVNPAFVERTGIDNPIDCQSLDLFTTPAFADLDADGDFDIVAGDSSGRFAYFENTGTATAPVFSEQTGGANPLDTQNVGQSSSPAFADLDGDGDLDLLSGESGGTFAYFENTGDATEPAFTAGTGAANPLDGRDVGQASSPVFADLDGDGDLDLAAGSFSGTFSYFENTGTATAPAFTPRTGAANPFDGEDVGIVSRPAFADLDGDGDLDLLAGEREGTFLYYVPEPGPGLLGATSLAVLGWLARRRRARPGKEPT